MRKRLIVEPSLAPTIKGAYNGDVMAILWSLVAVLFVADAVCFWMLRVSYRRQQRYLDRPVTESVPYDDRELREAISNHTGTLDDQAMRQARDHKGLVIAVAEGIERVDRSERRIGATIKRAQEKLAASGFSDPGVDSEIEGLRVLDGDGVDIGGLPALQPSLDDPRDQPSSVPGLTIGQLQRVRGL